VDSNIRIISKIGKEVVSNN